MQVLLYFSLIVGLSLLVYATSLTLDAATTIARLRAGSRHIVAAILLALGTALPELTVTMLAGLMGAPVVGVGTVVGSTAINLVLIPGLMALVQPFGLPRRAMRVHVPFILASVVLLFALTSGLELGVTSLPSLSPSGGLALLIVVSLFIFYAQLRAHAEGGPLPEPQPEGAAQRPRLARHFLMLFVGMGLIALGGLVGVYAAIRLMLSLNLSQSVVGLLIVAVITAIPELTLVLSGRGREGSILQNLTASSIFNLLLVPGIAALVGGLAFYPRAPHDLLLMLAAVLILYVFHSRGDDFRFGRIRAAILVLIYAGFVAFVICRNVGEPARVLF